MKVMALIGLLFLSQGASAFAIWPSADAPCNTTLLACVDGSPSGEYIEIRTSEVIEESVFTNKNVSLVAGAGYRPVFGNHRSITIISNGSDPITIQGLTFLNGGIAVVTNGPATSVNVLDNDITSLNRTSPGLELRTGSNAQMTINVRHNQVNWIYSGGEPDLEKGAIRVYDGNETVGGYTGQIAGNTIRATGPFAHGMVIHNSAEGDFVLDVAGNEIHGAREAAMLFFLDNHGGSMDLNVAHNAVYPIGGEPINNGIEVKASLGVVEVDLVNNTVVGMDQAVHLNEIGIGSIDAYVQNNLVAYNHMGFRVESGVTLVNDYNLSYQNTLTLNFTLGANGLNQNPKIKGLTNARLVDDSPALDVGNNIALLALGGTPLLDADGTARLKSMNGSAAVLDLGAYEAGDRWFTHQATAVTDHTSMIHNEHLNGAVGLDSVHISANATPSGAGVVRNNANEGIYYGAGFWHVFNQGFEDLLEASSFNVVKYGSISNTFRHSASEGGNSTSLDVSALDGEPDRILMVTQNWNAIYNDHPIGILYGFGSWVIINLDLTDMPVNSRFNVYHQPRSKSAWRHVAATGNISFDGTLLDHPLLNNQPCAQVQVTQEVNNGVFNPTPIGVAFDSRPHSLRWGIFNQDASPMPEGAAFHVMISPAQIAECSDVIFADAFE